MIVIIYRYSLINVFYIKIYFQNLKFITPIKLIYCQITSKKMQTLKRPNNFTVKPFISSITKIMLYLTING